MLISHTPDSAYVEYFHHCGNFLGVSGLETVAFHRDREDGSKSRIRKVIQIYHAEFVMSVDKQLGKNL